ncbi:citrate synthase [Natronobacterium gregoryi]|uniref:Citrate synthase n=2 Tax=Natronobacterium gregoryi TaxID=44930 RepID=L0ANM1_NATGS|nr:citrate synthase [Natronobacterium gregoryi]AFZ74812.1 2-methylcitrate synthase/citrate synthase II [Natronobacterium gregoryi SP2]ELY66145.1 2-methylcitrate synthase/citrate synthase II [Natronobacterium gregoryi SP2]PLK19480.1 citrate synthase [Natronobacterium gregoryi SP2]SFJ43585.1 citrate synthase [Natronobacterium gregoryi]
MATDLRKGLEGVLVAESELSSIDGDEGRLIYRGYPIEELARETSYEEVLYLLWHGELPTETELAEFSEAIATEREVSEDVLATMERLADTGEQPMAALRTAVSMFSAHDPDAGADPDDLEATLRKGRRITAKIPTALAAFERYRLGEAPVDPDPNLGLAPNFLYMLTGERPDDVAAETFDQALILHADHGLNASTFTSMVIGSTMADIYSSVTGGIAALSGPLHGGANQDVVDVLIEINESDKDPLEWVEEATDAGRRIPGFGHRVYNVKDPRAHILHERSKELAENGDDKWYDITTTIETYLTEEKNLVEDGIAPNVDFYSGSVYYQLGLPTDMYTPIFAMSRVGGWIAHVLEYQEDNRLIRPRGRYVGPEDEAFVPLGER